MVSPSKKYMMKMSKGEEIKDETEEECEKSMIIEFFRYALSMEPSKRKEELYNFKHNLHMEKVAKQEKPLTPEEREKLNEFLNQVNKNMSYPKDQIHNLIIHKINDIGKLNDEMDVIQIKNLLI